MGRGFDIPYTLEGVKLYDGYGVRYTIGRGFDTPWVGAQYSIDWGFDIPWVGGSIYHG
jgi:hypothetical protein